MFILYSSNTLFVRMEASIENTTFMLPLLPALFQPAYFGLPSCHAPCCTKANFARSCKSQADGTAAMERWLFSMLHCALLTLWLCTPAAGLHAPPCLQSPAVLNDPGTFVLHGCAVVAAQPVASEVLLLH